MIKLSLKFQRLNIKYKRKNSSCSMLRISIAYVFCFTFCSIIEMYLYKINSSTFETSKQLYVLPTVILCMFCIYELKVLYEIDIARTIINISTKLSMNSYLKVSRSIRKIFSVSSFEIGHAMFFYSEMEYGA